jgi:hypothetical protein
MFADVFKHLSSDNIYNTPRRKLKHPLGILILHIEKGFEQVGSEREKSLPAGRQPPPPRQDNLASDKPMNPVNTRIFSKF